MSIILAKAINFLSIWGYELWQEMRSMAFNYQVEHMNDGMIHVSGIGARTHSQAGILQSQEFMLSFQDDFTGILQKHLTSI